MNLLAGRALHRTLPPFLASELEGLVAQHLRAWTAYAGGAYDLAFWRTRSGVEVDFVVYGAGGFWAIDVQASRQIRHRDLGALRSFRSEFPEATAILLYGGEERRFVDGIWCVPVEAFLRTLHPSRGVT